MEDGTGERDGCEFMVEALRVVYRMWREGGGCVERGLRGVGGVARWGWMNGVGECEWTSLHGGRVGCGIMFSPEVDGLDCSGRMWLLRVEKRCVWVRETKICGWRSKVWLEGWRNEFVADDTRRYTQHLDPLAALSLYTSPPRCSCSLSLYLCNT